MSQVIAKHNTLSRTFQWDSANFSNLERVLENLFNVPVNVRLTTKYTDEDGDLVTLTDDAELVEAWESTPQCLYLTITLTDTNTGLPVVLDDDSHGQQHWPTAPKDEPLPAYDPTTKPLPHHGAEKPLPAIRTAAAAAAASPVLAASSASEKHLAASTSGSSAASPPSDFDVLRNEFHYHRLLVMTAVEEAFRSLRASARERTPSQAEAKAKLNSFVDKSNQQRVLVQDAITSAVAGWREKMNEWPTPTEIADVVSRKLSEAHAYTAPAIARIRTQILEALERLFNAMQHERIEAANADAVVDVVGNVLEGATSGGDTEVEMQPLGGALRRPDQEPAEVSNVEPAIVEPTPTEPTPAVFANAPTPAALANAPTPAALANAPTPAVLANVEPTPAAPTVSEPARAEAVDEPAAVAEDLEDSSSQLAVDESLVNITAADAMEDPVEQEVLAAVSASPLVTEPVEVAEVQGVQEPTDDFVFVQHGDDNDDDVNAEERGSALAWSSAPSYIMPSIMHLSDIATPYVAEIAALREMGFEQPNAELHARLERANGNVDAVLESLVH